MITAHGVERDTDLLGHGWTYSLPAGCRTSGQKLTEFERFRAIGCLQGPFFAAVLLQRRQRRKRMARRIAGRRRLEHRAGLARIGIEPQQQELGCHRAEIDHALVQDLGRLGGVDVPGVPHRRPAQSGLRPAGWNSRSTSSSTSFSIGSSVTTQRWITVAETRPATRRPSAPCRVRSKAASSRGSSRSSAAAAIALRCASSGASSMLRPVSGTSATTTGTLHGGLRRRRLPVGLLAARFRGPFGSCSLAHASALF